MKIMTIKDKGDRRTVVMKETKGGHFAQEIGTKKEWSTEETVLLMEKVDDVMTLEKMKKIHVNMNHKLEENMLYAYQNANKLTDDVRKQIKDVIENCDVCKKFSRSLGRPKVALPKVMYFNEIVRLDLKQFRQKYVIPMVMMSSMNEELYLEVQACEVDVSVPLLCGKDLME